MKQRYLYITLMLSAILTGCGVSDTINNTGNSPSASQPSQGSSGQSNASTLPETNTAIPDDAAKQAYICEADGATDRAFSDTYVTRKIDDIPWPDAFRYNTLTVHDIETIFTAAREKDPTVSSAMVLPPQAVWENMSSGEKVLYLVNKARCDRGIKPFEGLDDAITSVAQNYASYLATHPDDYANDPHNADGRSPFERMQQDAGVDVGTNADFFRYGENIASHAIGTSLQTYPIVPEPEAKAVYGWLYEDVANQASPYGHRKFLLANKLVENAGDPDKEGLIGVGVATRQYRDAKNNNWTQKIVVMDGFDPKSSWDNDLAHVHGVTLYR